MAKIRGGRSHRLNFGASLRQARNRLEEIQNCNSNQKEAVNPLALVESEHEYYLVIAILIYLAHRDDGVFTIREKYYVRKEIRKSKEFTSRVTRKELKWMLYKEYNESVILKLIKDYRIKNKVVKSIFKTFKKQFENDEINLENLRMLDYYLESEL